MRFVIKHEIKGRIRIHLVQKRMTLQQADILQYYLEIQENIETARIEPAMQLFAIMEAGMLSLM